MGKTLRENREHSKYVYFTVYWLLEYAYVHSVISALYKFVDYDDDDDEGRKGVMTVKQLWSPWL